MIRDDSGFTLIELIVAIAILGVIVVALGTGLVSILDNSNATTQRLTESHDAQIAASYFPNDVQSADVSGTVTSSDARCDQSGNTTVVRLAWTEYSVSGAISAYKLVVYSVEPSSGPGVAPLLRRRFCQGSTYASLNATPISDVVVSRTLAALSAATVCTPPSVCPGEPSNAIVLSVIEQSGYTFSVAGIRRAA